MAAAVATSTDCWSSRECCSAGAAYPAKVRINARSSASSDRGAGQTSAMVPSTWPTTISGTPEQHRRRWQPRCGALLPHHHPRPKS